MVEHDGFERKVVQTQWVVAVTAYVLNHRLLVGEPIVSLFFLFLSNDFTKSFLSKKRRICLAFSDLFYLVKLGKGTEDRKATVEQSQVNLPFLLPANQI